MWITRTLAGDPMETKNTEIEILDVIPPEPSKLCDLFSLLEAEGSGKLEGITAVPDLIDLRSIAPESKLIMFPCRASGLRMEGRVVYFLDEAPGLGEDGSHVVLVGCNLSLKIFREVYGFRPAFVNMCPKDWIQRDPDVSNGNERVRRIRRITRCCRVKRGFEKIVSRRSGRTAVVAWGVSREEFLEAIAWVRSEEP